MRSVKNVIYGTMLEKPAPWVFNGLRIYKERRENRKMDYFWEEAQRLGTKRAMVLWDRRDRIKEYVRRQKELAGTGTLLLALGVLAGGSASLAGVFSSMAGVLLFVTATQEARGMRATGRYWRTERGMRKVEGIYIRPLGRAVCHDNGRWYRPDGKEVHIPNSR